MILKKCYITGFGRLSDFEYEFSDGLNTIFEENGWGKTTFSVFLKSMFYGLVYSPNSKTLLERKHYLPWDGGVFGGSLVFETEKGVFRVERTFGEKGSEDTFKLFDESTGRESDAYSENLGEEIFGVDRESFEKTVFIGQSDISTGITDKINAKVGNLSQTRDDLDEFEAAVLRIDEARKTLKSKRKNNPGKLDMITDEINELKRRTEEIPSLYEAYRKQDEITKNRNQTIEEIKIEKKKLKAEITAREKFAEKTGALTEKKERLKSDNDRLSKLDLFFVNGSPPEDEIDDYDELLQRYIVDKRTVDTKRKDLLSEEEERRIEELFQSKLPSEDEIANWQQDADRIKELRMKRESSKLDQEDEREMKALREFFQKGRPEHSEITEIMKLEAEISALSGQEKATCDTLERLENDRRNNLSTRENAGKGAGALYIVLAIVFGVGSAIFFTMFEGSDTRMVGIGSGLLAIFFLVSYFVRGIRLNQKRDKAEARILREIDDVTLRLEDIKNAKQELIETSDAFFERFDIVRDPEITGQLNDIQRKLDRVEHLEKLDGDMMAKNSEAIEELSEKQLALYTILTPYAKSYGIDLYHEMREQELIRNLLEDYKRKVDNDKEKGNVTLLENRVNEEEKEIATFLERFNYEAIDDEEEDVEEYDFSDKLSLIRQSTDSYQRLQSEVDKLETEIKELSADIPESSFGESIEELQEKDAQLDEMLTTNTTYYDRDVDTLAEISDQIVSLEDEYARIPALEEEKRQIEKKILVLDSAKDYMKLARDRFMAEYMGPLQSKMVSYLDEIYPEKDNRMISDEFELDMDLNVRFKYRGRTISSEYLSEGYKDMVSLSVRFALIDAMYDRELPTVILDDPFTSFDNDKISEGLKLLDKASQSKQIIYFTCHTSRVKEG